MEFKNYDVLRNDLLNLEESMRNDDLEEVMHKNYGIFSKKNVVKMFMKQGNKL